MPTPGSGQRSGSSCLQRRALSLDHIFVFSKAGQPYVLCLSLLHVLTGLALREETQPTTTSSRKSAHWISIAGGTACRARRGHHCPVRPDYLFPTLTRSSSSTRSWLYQRTRAPRSSDIPKRQARKPACSLEACARRDNRGIQYVAGTQLERWITDGKPSLRPTKPFSFLSSWRMTLRCRCYK
ncbi:hypothetical protein BJY52DRAFT_270291 [Lactarius psammicola]|nr:hypothetical protein BJY52DRAFT_270291 [Lactarius psammicola]